ncbi:MAG: transposase [Acidobacteria bacterium]|nr:transposase [Acidobacteriota bacterium]
MARAGSRQAPASGIPAHCAIGKHGSIALVERCIRTLKDEGVRRWLALIQWRIVGRELVLFAEWYDAQRPHAGLAGATLDEIYLGQMPAHRRPRFELRAQWPRNARCVRPQAPVRGRPGPSFPGQGGARQRAVSDRKGWDPDCGRRILLTWLRL